MESVLPSSKRSNKTKRQGKWKKSLLPWLFVFPTLCLSLLVMGIPAIGTLILSLTDWNGISAPHFIGLQNFMHLFQDRIFYIALFNNLKWLVVFCILPILIGLFIAVLVSKVKRGQMFYRTLYFMPYIISTVVAARIWSWIYYPFGGVNGLFDSLGLHALADVPYLVDPHVALYFVILAEVWRYWGFLLVLFLAALHQVDRSLEEAALIDGANKIQIFWRIILPQIRPTFMMILMLTAIWSFTSFDYVYLMTSGGPGHATELLSTYMYKEALYNHHSGYASAVALIMSLFGALIIAVFGFLRKKGWDI